MAGEDKDASDSDYDYYDAVDDEEEGARGPIRIVVALIVLAAFAGVVWIAYNQGVREGQRLAPQVVRAEQSPAKIVPEGETPGPAQPSEQRVFDRLNGETTEEPEQLLPPPETPVRVAEPADGGTTSPLAPPPGTEEAELALRESADIAPPDSTPRDSAPEPVRRPERAAPAEPEPDEVADAEVDAGLPIVEVPDTPMVAPPSGPSGDRFLVQIGAFRTAEEALQGWQRARKKHDDLLEGFTPDVAAVNLGDRGVYHRLRFGPFVGRDGAVQICEALKARRQDCLVVKQ